MQRTANGLSTYNAKRNFGITPEPRGARAKKGKTLQFVVQKHHARTLHYDFRLELGGALKSWAVPKGPSLDPVDKRLAVHVEDHPLEYGKFEGTIPPNQYGSGEVILWDRGDWIPHGDPRRDYKAGKLKFELKGKKLHGNWTLVRTRLKGSGDKEQWLLIKEKDEEARPHDDYDITAAEPDSVNRKTKNQKPAVKEKSDAKLRAAKRSAGLPAQSLKATLGRDKPAAAVGYEKPASRQRRGRSAAASSADSGAPIRKMRGRATKEQRVAVGNISVSHPDRVIDPASGLTKLDVALYYEKITPALLPHLVNRPVSLVRLPDGLKGEQFFQKHIGKGQIPEANLLDAELDPGHPPLIVLETPAAIVGAAQMGVLELHTWNAVARSIERPDRLVFDLDPDPSLPWARVLEAAELTRTLLDELGVKTFVKTSGGSGLHIVVPLRRLHAWDTAKEFSRGVAEHLAATIPTRFSAKMGAANRVGKVFVDYLRNNRGSTTVSAFSLRARPGLPVSVPVTWEELVETKQSAQWNLRNVHERLADQGHDPWKDYEQSRQSLRKAINALRATRDERKETREK